MTLTAQDSDTVDGILQAWKLEIVGADAMQLSGAWINSGYNGSIQSSYSDGVYAITNADQGYIDELQVGDKITFTIQGGGSGFENVELAIRFVSLTEPEPIVVGDPTCASPTPIVLPFSTDASGPHCWEVTENISYVNSWSGAEVSINDADYSNLWSSSMPNKINDRYYIYFNGGNDYSHFEVH